MSTTFKPGLVREWTTAAGLRAAIIMRPLGHHCGYVAVPFGHPMFGADYADVDVTVHGGALTYGDSALEHVPLRTDEWWFGYDCAQFGDAPHPGNPFSHHSVPGVFRDEAFCVQQCEDLARQLAAMA